MNIFSKEENRVKCLYIEIIEMERLVSVNSDKDLVCMVNIPNVIASIVI